MNKLFEGEHLLPGHIGQIAVYSAFAFSIIAAVSFFISSFSKSEENRRSWKRTGLIAYFIQAVAVITIIISLYIIIHDHLFEYYYAYAHSNKALQMKYLFACFWEGQEGSFLLWMFWNTVLGTILIFSVRENLSNVLSVFSVVQVFLGSMLLGIYFGDYKIGSTPFVLLRDVMVDAPIFKRADYLSFIQDGKGLNPLLQNYWMVIHPPILFLGFASTLVPFSFALSALMSRKFTSWTKQVLPWALFSCAVLGTGIMMGGAWAYESLTFGGYWAWDPVENASLVPWLILIAGMHTTLVFNKTGRSLRTTFILYILTFILVLYSTFLTRSGILGDTSVHAFTDLGMSGQLLIYMGALTLPAIFLMIWFWRKIPTVKKDENVWSREFWIFIGTILFLVSAIHITYNTSLPVINKMFGTNLALPADIVGFYNRFQVIVGILLLLLSSFALYLKFRKSEIKKFGKTILILLILTIPITIAIAYAAEFTKVQYILLLYAGIFGILANGFYLINTLKGKWRISGPAVGHFGFAVLMTGILISSSKQEIISVQNNDFDFSTNARRASDAEGNMLLMKGKPTPMRNYIVTYVGDSASPPNNYYRVDYELFDSTSGKLKEKFSLWPNAQINPEMGLISNPDTRHYWLKDVYTHVTSVPKPAEENEELKEFKTSIAKIGDTIFTANSYIVVENLQRITTSGKTEIADDDVAIEAILLVKTLDGGSFTMKPIYHIKQMKAYFIEDELPELGLTIRLTEILPDENKVELQVSESEVQEDFIVLKAIIFPFINLVWLGVVITVSGFLISIVRIWRKKKSITSPEDKVQSI